MLVDVIISVEYYLECLGDCFFGDEDILVIVEDVVVNLGYFVECIDFEELVVLQGDLGLESYYFELGVELE